MSVETMSVETMSEGIQIQQNNIQNMNNNNNPFNNNNNNDNNQFNNQNQNQNQDMDTLNDKSLPQDVDKNMQESNDNDDNHSEVMDVANENQQMRTIGRWYIGETLGKGGYSWVKKGFDKKTGKCVALKFMAKADDSWVQEQSKQVVTEIEALKQIRHPNVMKLYAYNLNAKYPTTEKQKVDTILLVLEYAPGGELFDILYYTSYLEPIVARTYFRQMLAGLEACHNVGVVHRDIKPQNLLLDARFNLKLTDFGLSKIFESDADTSMKTTYVGTRGYQAPELLMDKPYDLTCDIFSAGVVLFILLTGYPPFEQAHISDRWFKSLAKGDYEKFWKLHRTCSIANDDKVKDLLQRMLEYDPKRRISINDIKKHPWYLDKILEGKDLIRALRHRHQQMEAKRINDARKIKDLQQSVKVNRDMPCPVCTAKDVKCNCFPIPFFPDNEIESIIDTHTTASWKEIVNKITEAIGRDGQVTLEPKSGKLICTLKLAPSDMSQDAQVIKFEIQIYKSREYQKSSNIENSEDNDAKNDNNDVYVVRMHRLQGNLALYQKTRNYVFKSCAEVLTGLPKWALKLQQQKLDSMANAENDNDNDDDDYENLLKNDASLQNSNNNNQNVLISV